jgi:Ca2+-binding RTX toxin-like protein
MEISMAKKPIKLTNGDDGTASKPFNAKGGNDIVNGRGGNDHIDGGKGKDTLNGGAGDDFLYSRAGQGSDTLNGGEGSDTAVIGGNFADAVVTENADGTQTIAIGGRTVTTSGIESFKFDDKTVSAADLVNDAPTGTSTATLADGTEDTAYVVKASDLLAGFTDPNGDTLSITNLKASDLADVKDNGDGTFTITPAANDNGDVTLTFNVTDGKLSVAGTNKINFKAVDDIIALTKDTDTPAMTKDGDIVTGVVSALSSENTLNALDLINDIGGTDTLKVDLKADFSGFSGTGKLAAVENIELSNSGAVARTFTATGVTGADKYSLTGAVNLAGLAEIDTLVAGTRLADLSIAYAAKVTDGAADALNLSVTGFGVADNAATTAVDETDAVKITVAGIETTNLTVTGVNVLDLSGVDSKAITASGAGSMQVTNFNAATKTVDASKVTGAVSLDLASLTDATSIVTGTGADTIRAIATSDITVNATLAGGDGADTLVLTSGAATTVQYTQTGIETVAFGDLGGALTMSLKNSTGVTTVVAQGTGATGGALDELVTVANVGSGALTINLQGANANGGTDGITADGTGAATINVDTPASTATVALPSDNTLDVTLTGASSVSLSVASKMSYSGQIVASAATSVVAALEGAALAGSSITADKATSVLLTSVNAASDIDLIAGAATSLVVSNAKNLDLTGSTLTSLESLTSSGAGNLNAAVALAKLNSATITNTGDVDLGNLGSNTLGYGITVSSTGAKTFDVGTMTTKGNAVNLTVAAAVGAVTVGAINTLDSGDILGNVNAVIATGGGLTSMGAVTGNNVTLDFSGVLAGVTTYGTINAEGAVSIAGSQLKANTIGDLNLTGTSQTVALTGGIDVDNIDIDGTATTTSVTVTGDLGVGTDIVSVDLVANATTASSASLAGLANYETGTLAGSAQNNTLTGGVGVDTITGLAGADTISGGAGADVITGGTGADVMSGGDGADDFVFAAAATDTVAAAASIAGVDKVTDAVFNAGAADQFDLIETVTAVNTAVSGSVSEATFIANMNTLLAVGGGAGFNTAVAADVSAAVVNVTGGGLSGRVFLAVDANGDDAFTAADFVVEITGSTVTSLTTADFF